jgi:hypothetical protein
MAPAAKPPRPKKGAVLTAEASGTAVDDCASVPAVSSPAVPKPKKAAAKRKAEAPALGCVPVAKMLKTGSSASSTAPLSAEEAASTAVSGDGSIAAQGEALPAVGADSYLPPAAAAQGETEPAAAVAHNLEDPAPCLESAQVASIPTSMVGPDDAATPAALGTPLHCDAVVAPEEPAELASVLATAAAVQCETTPDAAVADTLEDLAPCLDVAHVASMGGPDDAAKPPALETPWRRESVVASEEPAATASVDEVCSVTVAVDTITSGTVDIPDLSMESTGPAADEQPRVAAEVPAVMGVGTSHCGVEFVLDGYRCRTTDGCGIKVGTLMMACEPGSASIAETLADTCVIDTYLVIVTAILETGLPTFVCQDEPDEIESRPWCEVVEVLGAPPNRLAAATPAPLRFEAPCGRDEFMLAGYRLRTTTGDGVAVGTKLMTTLPASETISDSREKTCIDDMFFVKVNEIGLACGFVKVTVEDDNDVEETRPWRDFAEIVEAPAALADASDMEEEPLPSQIVGDAALADDRGIGDNPLPCPIVSDCSVHTVQTAYVGVADGSGFASSSHTDARHLGDPSPLMACLRLHAGSSQHVAAPPSIQDVDDLSDEVVNTSAVTLV